VGFQLEDMLAQELSRQTAKNRRVENKVIHHLYESSRRVNLFQYSLRQLECTPTTFFEAVSRT